MKIIEKNIKWHNSTITRKKREQLNGHKACVLWFTGLSCAGKSTLAHAVEQKLYSRRCHTFVLDGDNVRHGLTAGLGFSEEDRRENIRRVGEVAKLMMEAGMITLAAFISPFRADRDAVRSLMPHGDFMEIYCKADIEVCEQRDVKGFYKRARSGEIKGYTGVDSPYEPPVNPDLIIETGSAKLSDCVILVLKMLTLKGVCNAE